MGQIYTLFGSTGIMRPIRTDDLEIGQTVRQAKEGKVGTVCSVSEHGYLVVFEDGSESDSQTTSSISPFTKITPVEPTEIVSTEEVKRLLTLRETKKEADRLAAEAEKARESAETERLIAKLRTKYPWAEATGTNTKSQYARAASNLRTELRHAFPGCKISVTSESYSGGNCVNVRWSLGPTENEVRTIANKYKYGTFDAMTDCSGSDTSPYSRAVNIVLGQARSVSLSRRNDDLHLQVCQDIAVLFLQEFVSPNDRRQSDMNSNFTVGDYAYSALARASFPAGATYNGVEWTPLDGDEIVHANEILLIKIALPENPVSLISVVSTETSAEGGIIVTENEEKDGIEIRFPGKPDETVRSALKQMGFRWSKFQSMWYAKRSAERLAFAQTLAG